MAKAKVHYSRKQAQRFADMIGGYRRGDGTTLEDLHRYAANQARRNTGVGWRQAFGKLARWLQSVIDQNGFADGIEAPFTVLQEGNSKLPFFSWSTLPGINCPGAGACLKFCYSFRAWRYPAAFMRQCQNTILECTIGGWNVISEAYASMPASTAAFRLYVDGDFADLATAKRWFKLIGTRPEISAYGYSKSWRILLDDELKVPANYRLNLSSGSRYPEALKERLRARGFVRGEFVAVPIDSKGLARGFAKYEQQEYHRRVRESAAIAGHGKVFSCPGDCGSCTMRGHACGTQVDGKDLVPITIAIGVH